jgi:prepilin-type N-terminal cleavage/methylation domain-containing protein
VQPARSPRTEGGFTLIETLLVVSILGIGSTIAVAGYGSYARTAEFTGTRDSVVSALRAANQRAITEATEYCVRFDAGGTTWTTYRGACGGTVVKGPEEVGGKQVALASIDFVRPDGTTGSKDVTFTARGTASKGSLKVTRSNSSTTYTISVEGLTARVSTS